MGAKSGPAPEDGWKDFVDPAQWQIVEESMQRYAYAKKLGSAALQQLTVRENEPAHVKIAALHKSLLHQASADAEDPAVAKALVTIAATYPSALAKIAARHAEEQAVPRIDPVADLRSKARTCQAALAERLHELQEETRRYRSLHRNMNELKQMNTEIEASLAEASKQRAALAANNAFVDANSRIEADTVSPLCHMQFAHQSLVYYQPIHTNGLLRRLTHLQKLQKK